MLTARFDPLAFFGHTEHVALCVPAAEVFSVLKRTIDLPSQWAALVSREVGDHVVVPAGGRVDADDAETVLFLRGTPVDLSFEEKELRSRDGYSCEAKLSVRVAIPIERSEMQSFSSHVLGSHRVVHVQRLASFLQPNVRDFLTRHSSEQEVAELMSADGQESAVALAAELAGVCFASGLALQGRPALRFESAGWKKVETAREYASARRAEHEAHRDIETARQHARAAHLDELSGLLVRLRDLQNQNPNVSMPELIRTFSERQRGELYAALFAEEIVASTTKMIVAAAGDELLFFRPDDLASPMRRLRITGTVGPIRSIQTGGDGALWLGAATGLYRLPLDRTEPDLVLSVPNARSVRGGFNSVAALNDRIWASHSELGIIEWSVDSPGSPRRLFENLAAAAKAVRDIKLIGKSLYCAIDATIISWSALATSNSSNEPTIFSGAPAIITAICVMDHAILAGTAEGDIVRWHQPGDSPEVLHAGMRRPIESLCMANSHGIPRLVFADTTSKVQTRVLDDTFHCNYEAGGQTLRRVEVADDLLVATNELRDRLICWRAGQPGKPIATIPISRLCGHSIQDVCLV